MTDKETNENPSTKANSKKVKEEKSLKSSAPKTSLKKTTSNKESSTTKTSTATKSTSTTTKAKTISAGTKKSETSKTTAGTKKASTVKKSPAKTTKATSTKPVAKTTRAKSTSADEIKQEDNTNLQNTSSENLDNASLNLNSTGELKSTNTENSTDVNPSDSGLPPVYNSSEEATNKKETHLPKPADDNHLSEISQEPEEVEEQIEPMTLLDHLKELRIRLTRIVIMLIIGFFASYSFAELTYNLLTVPLTINMPANASLIYTSPPGLFFVYLKVAFVMSFFVSSPYTFYQLWAFVAPGLYSEEKKVLMPLSLISAFFFLAGAAFCFYMVLPIAFKFFMGFATETITPMISVEEYLTFVLKLLIAFGVVFEMPLFSFFLARMGLVTGAKMRKWRKYSILLMFICAALLTPPDVFSQTLMAMPMILLYEVSILIAQMVEKDKKKEKDTSEAKIETK